MCGEAGAVRVPVARRSLARVIVIAVFGDRGGFVARADTRDPPEQSAQAKHEHGAKGAVRVEHQKCPMQLLK